MLARERRHVAAWAEVETETTLSYGRRLAPLKKRITSGNGLLQRPRARARGRSAAGSPRFRSGRTASCKPPWQSPCGLGAESLPARSSLLPRVASPDELATLTRDGARACQQQRVSAAPRPPRPSFSPARMQVWSNNEAIEQYRNLLNGKEEIREPDRCAELAQCCVPCSSIPHRDDGRCDSAGRLS
jgi:hypothetical protein